MVRVSRRVGQVTDRFATDAESTSRLPPAVRPRLEGTGDSPPSLNDRTETRPEADRERSSSVRQRANAIRVYNTVAETTATFPERF